MIPDPHIGKKVKVKRAVKGTGLGLFSDENIKLKEYIINYVGEIIPNASCVDHPGRYLFEVDDHFTINGQSRKNIARYVNHSCDPNVEIELESGNINMYAKKSIKKGEELTFDYGEEYFDEFIKPYGCKCLSCTKKVIINKK